MQSEQEQVSGWLAGSVMIIGWIGAGWSAMAGADRCLAFFFAGAPAWPPPFHRRLLHLAQCTGSPSPTGSHT